MTRLTLSARGLACVALVALAASLHAQTDQPPASPPAKRAAGSVGDALRAGFADPGEAARPRVWWHWMNGNVTADGARKDMEWMKRVGIAGLQAFDAGQATPQVVATRLPYMTDGWKRVFAQTARLAGAMDLELGIAASPGWSETGGPWVTAPDAMKKLAWSETRIPGGRPFRGLLAKPPTTTGFFQTSTGGTMLGGRAPGQNPPEFYADQKVLAVRVPDPALPPATITSSGGSLNAAALSNGDLETTAASLNAAPNTGGESWIRFDYGQRVTVRGLTVASSIIAAYYDALDPSLREGTPPSSFRFDASDDGRTWRDTGAVVVAGRPQRTISVDAVRARYFRFVSIRPSPPPPRAPRRFERPQAPVPNAIAIRELVLRSEPTVHSFEEKAAFYENTRYYGLPGGTARGGAVALGDVVDLTKRMSPDGTLVWTPPRGHWLVLRMGYSLTGAMNRPASPEATGLEVDKLDADAVRRYMTRYLDMYRDASGGRIGAGGLRVMMFDSWEASNENWTPRILEQFRWLRGYDPTPWLPALTGFQIGTPAQSDGFLWDWRRTLQQLLKENHYDLLTGMLHDAGMIRYGEAHEELFSTMGDGMEMKQSADVPMAAMWQVNTPGQIEPVYLNDIQESASVAHIYGQNVTAAESLTGGPPFGSAPWDLKPTADAILIGGVNRFVIHTSTHQPLDRGPGMTLGVGQYFTRNETWAEQAKPWIDYLSRASFMMQQGRGASDVAVFYGEVAPVIANYRETFPAVPEGYRYDYVNADVILNRLDVTDGALTTRTGMRYAALFLGRGAERVSLPVLRRIAALVEGGAVVIGPRPQGSPSLADDPAAVKALLDRLWPGGVMARVGRGRVFAASDTADPLAAIGMTPDFTYAKPRPDSHVMFIHRKLPDGDAYFLSNRLDRTERIEGSFRVAGRAAELWDPATGLTRPASYRIEGERTIVDVPLDRFGSTVVVFRGPAAFSGRRVVPDPVVRTLSSLAGPWRIAFQSDRGAPATAIFARLGDFRDQADPGIRYFSGVATYRTALDVPRTALRDGRIWLDLGDVRDLAEVWVNGRMAGTAWKPPYRVDISAQARPGRNMIEVRSVNLWVNRLIGDVQPGVTRKITFTAADGNIDATTARSRGAQMPYKADAPLRPSGLLGPVTVQIEKMPAPR